MASRSGLATVRCGSRLIVRAQLNALTAEMADRVAEELEAAHGGDDVRVVVLVGTGDAFSSGADLGGEDAHENFDVSSLARANRIIRAITSSPLPCVAAVNGVAAGVGCSAALACDLVVAKESALFVLAFSRIGLMPDGGATAIVAASAGRARAMRMAEQAMERERTCQTILLRTNDVAERMRAFGERRRPRFTGE